MTIANGRISNRTTDAGFIAKLTEGTSLTVSIQGTVKGTLNGMAVDIIGTVKYVYAFGASTWTKSKDTLATAPDLPAGAIRFTPAPGCTGSFHVATNGIVVNETGTALTSARNKDVWPLEGRTALISVVVFGQGSGCDLTNVDANTDCAAVYGAGTTCEKDCLDVKATL